MFGEGGQERGAGASPTDFGILIEPAASTPMRFFAPEGTMKVGSEQRDAALSQEGEGPAPAPAFQTMVRRSLRK